MIPLQKVKDIIDKHNILEKELSSGKVDPKLFAKKSIDCQAIDFFPLHIHLWYSLANIA